MIASDQPTIFPNDISVYVSSAVDGTMLDRTKSLTDKQAIKNRQIFCHRIGLNYENVVFQKITYDDTQTYSKLTIVGKNEVTAQTESIAADGLITSTSGIGMMLPIADCVATVVFDRSTRQMAMLHLGRHSSVTKLLEKTFNRMIEHGAAMDDILVWMSPSAKLHSYRLDYFDQADEPAWKPYVKRKTDGVYVDLTGFNRQVCLNNGVAPDNIEISPIDTYTNKNYFSHSRGDTTKRFVVVAMMQ